MLTLKTLITSIFSLFILSDIFDLLPVFYKSSLELVKFYSYLIFTFDFNENPKN